MTSSIHSHVLPLALALTLFGLLAGATDTTTAQPEDDIKCQRLDAAIRYKGIDYLFVGPHSVKLDGNLMEVDVKDKYDDWGGLPRIDSALSWPGDGYPYFFQGGLYYSYYWGSTHGPYKNSAWTPALEEGVNAAGAIGEKSFYFTKHCELVTSEDSVYSDPAPLEDMSFPCEVDAAIGLDDDRLAVIRHDQYRIIYHNGTVSEAKDANSLLDLKSFRLCASDEDDGDLPEDEENE